MTMVFSGLQLSCCLASLLLSVPCSVAHPEIWGELKEMESGVHAQEVIDWVLHQRVQGHEVIRPIFMLRHSKEQLAKFEETLLAVSTPGDPRYGQHLSRAEVAEELPPIPGGQEAVISWLSYHGVSEVLVGPTGDMVEASMTAEVAEDLFSTQLHHFNHTTGVSVIRAVTPYSVPWHIADLLYVVGNLAYLPHLSSPPAAPAERAKSESVEKVDSAWQSCWGCATDTIQPAVLQKAYEFDAPWYPDSVLQKTSMAIAAFQGVSFDAWDCKLFEWACGLNTPVEVSRTIGPQLPLACVVPIINVLCEEALLDVQVIKAVGGSIPLTVVSSVEYSYLKWIREFDNLEDLPHVISISYGRDEIQEDSTEYMDAVNAQFMKLGARGASVLIASGDQGTHGRTGYMHGKFHPDFPASSPYVTSVGGTDFLKPGVIGEEKAWSGSGGGFSEHFPAPSYQRDAIDIFLNRSLEAGTLPPEDKWNSTGRGYPDLAALGGTQNPYCIQATLRMLPVAGTSASAPMVAGLIARLNALRIQEGAPPLGFLNPFIYQNLDAFNDVKVGMNGDSRNASDGFQAVPGWDPTTGAGTPNFPKLRTAAMAALGQGSVAEQQATQSLHTNLFILSGCVAAVLVITFTIIARRGPKLATEDYYISVDAL
mmetsp:Transcript_46550/g.81983  ORF Transcript_46550/g.81983 Transcript_46550/m.81983 type:complete len:651 (-) Transcript_46550:338-2290(-)